MRREKSKQQTHETEMLEIDVLMFCLPPVLAARAAFYKLKNRIFVFCRVLCHENDSGDF